MKSLQSRRRLQTAHACRFITTPYVEKSPHVYKTHGTFHGRKIRENLRAVVRRGSASREGRDLASSMEGQPESVVA